MLFNSWTFAVFFAVVYVGYLRLMRRHRWQNLLLLVASYVFYGWWDVRFLSLIVISTLVDYGVGRALGRATDEGLRRRLLAASMVTNLGILGFFKYFDFFVESFAGLVGAFGLQANVTTLNILLPVGISFYTFQTMSYTIDIYRGQLRPTGSLLNFATFVAFFPQLVAGPIERAVTFLPQVERPRRITAAQVEGGLWLILWGLFKKVAVADRAALVANEVFNNYTSYSGLDILIGVLAFTVQIYGDFSGYTDIARGIAKLLGFELMLNFRLPYFAVSPSDFWRRWHISLSTWLRDYLYIPLGGNRGGVFGTYRNLMVTMLLGGLWHGARWNFVLWGAYHGLILVLFRLLDRTPIDRSPWERPVRAVVQMAFMFGLTVFGWLLFRVETLAQLGGMLGRVSLAVSGQSVELLAALGVAAAPLLAVDVYQYVRGDLFAVPRLGVPLRSVVYSLLLVWMFVYGVRASVEFVYFQF